MAWIHLYLGQSHADWGQTWTLFNTLAWLFAQDDSIVPIPGMKQRKDIDENLAAVKLSIPSEVIKTLKNMDMDVYGNRHNTYNLQFVDTES